MTALNRTDLAVSRKAELAAAAFALQLNCDTMSDLARQFDVSRPTVYAAGQTARTVLGEYFGQVEPGGHSVVVDERQLERTIIGLRLVAPNSIRPIEALLPIVYPGLHVSYGKIQEILVRAEQKAADYNKSVDLSNIEAGALDEMFSQGDPVLAGVDLDSGYLFLLKRCESRSSKDWAQQLQAAQQQGLSLKKVVKDAALGIAAGVAEVFPEAEQRDDCFHALYAMGKVRRILEQRAYGAIGREQEAQKKLDEVHRTGRGDRTHCVRVLAHTRTVCTRAIELHDQFEAAARAATEAMQFIDLRTATLRTSAQMQSTIRAAAEKMIALGDEKCIKVGKYIRNRASGLALYINEMNVAFGELTARYSEVPVRLAGLICRLGQDLDRQLRPWARSRDERHMLGALAMLQDVAPETHGELLSALQDVLLKRHRASSAIEGFNAALRPFLYVHKCVTPGFLELFRAYYNLRTRRWGRHKGTSAHELLAGERVADWLSKLGYPPSSALN